VDKIIRGEVMIATREQLKQAAKWGDRLTSLIDKAEQQDIDLRLIRSILKDHLDSVNERIGEREAKDKR
jgi:hypothetical protein